MPRPLKETELRKLLSDHIPGQWTAIDSHTTMRGIPDTEYCFDSHQTWIELKIIKGNKLREPLKRSQAAWINKRREEGRASFIIASHRHDGGPRLGKPIDHLYIWNHWYDQFLMRSEDVTDKFLGRFSKPYNWKFIHSFLLTQIQYGVGPIVRITDWVDCKDSVLPPKFCELCGIDLRREYGRYYAVLATSSEPGMCRCGSRLDSSDMAE